MANSWTGKDRAACVAEAREIRERFRRLNAPDRSFQRTYAFHYEGYEQTLREMAEALRRMIEHRIPHLGDDCDRCDDARALLTKYTPPGEPTT